MIASMTMRCKNCGKEFGLTPEYMAQYGGQATRCECGAGLIVPMPPAPVDGPQPPPVQGPYAAPSASGVIPYATPAVYQQQMMAQSAVWRDGNLLVCAKEVALPNHCCVRCNQPADAKPLRKGFYWHNPLLYLLLLSPLIYIIVALCVQEKATVVMPLCGHHRGRRRTLIWTSLGLLFAAIGAFVAAGMANEVMLALLGVAALLASAIIGVVASRTLTATRIDKQFAWYRGASADYLAALPAVYRP